jgi:hypothetical protein
VAHGSQLIAGDGGEENDARYCRHEVDFGDAPVRVKVYASEETVEIFVEADLETHAEEHRRFAAARPRPGLKKSFTSQG